MGKNLFDKVWDLHSVRTLPGGETQLLVGLARAAQATVSHTQARLSWLALGVSGHAPVLEDAAFPEMMAIPTNGTKGARAGRRRLRAVSCLAGTSGVRGGTGPPVS